MKKKLLKLTIIFFTLLWHNNFLYADENIILPENKPVIAKEQKSNKVANYLIPPKKPILKLEEVKKKSQLEQKNLNIIQKKIMK